MCLRTSASTPINSFFLQHGRPLRHPSSWSSSHTEPDNSLWSFWRPKQSRSELGPLQRPQNQDQMTAGLKDCYLQNRHLTSVFSTWTPFALCVHWKKKKKKSPLLLFERLRSDRSMTMRLQRGCGLQQQGGKRTGRVQRKDRKKIHRVRASSTVVSGTTAMNSLNSNVCWSTVGTDSNQGPDQCHTERYPWQLYIIEGTAEWAIWER